jgi:hypothetical protein
VQALWAAEVVKFLKVSLPGDRLHGWDHHYITAYQMGCEALSALGYANEKNWGAVPRVTPEVPETLPRWDDIVSVVVRVLHQNNQLGFTRPRQPDQEKYGDRHPSRWVDIRSRPGLGAAYVTDEGAAIMGRLGVLAGNEWTEIAETLMWRERPYEWELDFTGDPRFAAAVQSALDEIPDDIATEFDRLLTITDSDVVGWRRVSAEHAAGLEKEFGTRVISLSDDKSDEGIRKTIKKVRLHDFDWLFYRRWRLGDGWLSPIEAMDALEVFNDPLAMSVRAAVLERYEVGFGPPVAAPTPRPRP